MNKFLAAFSAFMKYAPYAVAGAIAVEQAVGAGNGQTKQQLVIAGILAATAAGSTVPNSTVQEIAGVTNLVVSVLNATGIFGKTTDTVVVPPATTGV